MPFTNPYLKVFTSEGWKDICKVRERDYVLSHTGKFRRVVAVNRENLKEVNEVIISGRVPYDNRGKEYKIPATPDQLFMINGKWQPISKAIAGDHIQIMANECPVCKKLIPIMRAYCSKSCASFITATNQHKRPEHTQSLSEKRKKLWAEYGGKLPWLESYLQSGRNKENLTRTPDRIEKQKKGMTKMVEAGLHPFQNPEARKKGARVLGQNKYSSFIERKVRWLLDQKGIGYDYNVPFERDVKCQNGNSKYYFIDIVLKDHKIAIEVDGEYWHKDKEADLKRQKEIEAKGFMVLRFSGEQVRNRLHECSAEIDRVLMNHNGLFQFMAFQIEKVEQRTMRRPVIALYNLELQKENSFIAHGFATKPKP